MLINRSRDVDLGTGLEFEARTFASIAHSHDLAEGTKAFSGKTQTEFHRLLISHRERVSSAHTSYEENKSAWLTTVLFSRITTVSLRFG